MQKRTKHMACPHYHLNRSSYLYRFRRTVVPSKFITSPNHIIYTSMSFILRACVKAGFLKEPRDLRYHYILLFSHRLLTPEAGRQISVATISSGSQLANHHLLIALRSEVSWLSRRGNVQRSAPYPPPTELQWLIDRRTDIGWWVNGQTDGL